MAYADEAKSETDPQRLRELYEECSARKSEVFGKYVTAVQDDTKYYEGDFGRELVPRELQEKRLDILVPPTGYNAVENAADHILTVPRVFVPARPSSPEQKLYQQSVAEEKRKFFEFFFARVAYEQGDPIAASNKHLIKSGKLVLKKTMHFDKLPKSVGNNVYDFLWDVEAIPPETVFEDTSKPHDPPDLFEVYPTTASAAKRAYPDASGSWRMGNKRQAVKVTEYWSKPEGAHRGEHVVWVDEEVVVNEPNPYARQRDDGSWEGYIPYVIRASGWGEVSGDHAPHRLYVGILRRMYSLLRAEGVMWNNAQIQLLASTFPITLTWGVGEDKEIEVTPGARVDLESKEQDIQFRPYPELPSSLFNMMRVVQSAADGLSKFGALGGVPMRGVDTATESDQVVQNATAKLSHPVLAIQSACVQLARCVLWDIEYLIEAPVTLFGVAGRGDAMTVLSPDEINGFYEVSIEMTTTDRVALQRAEARMALETFRALPVSPQWAMEASNIYDPVAQILEREEYETFISNPHRQLRVLTSLVGLGDVAKTIRSAYERTIAMQGMEPEGGGTPAAPPLTAEPVAERPGETAILNGQANAFEKRPDQQFQ